MTTPTSTTRSEAFHLLSRALLNIRSEAQSVLGSSETLSPEHQRVRSPLSINVYSRPFRLLPTLCTTFRICWPSRQSQTRSSLSVR